MLEVHLPKGPIAGSRGSQDGNPGFSPGAPALTPEGSLEKERSEGLWLLTIQLEFRAHCVMRCASGNVLVRCRPASKVALPSASLSRCKSSSGRRVDTDSQGIRSDTPWTLFIRRLEWEQFWLWHQDQSDIQCLKFSGERNPKKKKKILTNPF